jgi:hypothetical protein
MRFGGHFCAADFYKRGICRGICVRIVLFFLFGSGWIFDHGRAARAGSWGRVERRGGGGVDWRGVGFGVLATAAPIKGKKLEEKN